jgi:hypothetical protein
MPVNLELDNTKKHESANPPESFASAVGELNNAVLLSDLTSMDSSTKEASAQLNEAVEEFWRKLDGKVWINRTFLGPHKLRLLRRMIL